MSSNNYQKGLLKITLLITCLVGAGAGISLFSLRPKVRINPAPVDSSPRGPASVVAVASPHLTLEKPGTEKMATLNLECIQEGARADIESTAKQIRFYGQLCRSRSPLIETKIFNRTNGLAATVFISQEKLFTSDYLYLAEGANRIHMTHSTADGEKLVSELVVHRK